MNMKEPALDWPSVSESWIGITAGSGSNPNPDADPPSASPSRSEEPVTNIPCHILIVEDNSADVFLIREALKSAKIAAVLHVVKDGEQATQFLDAADSSESLPNPSLVILDINLPRKSGGQVLRHLRRSVRSSDAIVIAVSSSRSAKDREEMKALGADGYFHKPSEYDDFMKLGVLIRDLWKG